MYPAECKRGHTLDLNLMTVDFSTCAREIFAFQQGLPANAPNIWLLACISSDEDRV
jgi:hypothetical protein